MGSSSQQGWRGGGRGGLQPPRRLCRPPRASLHRQNEGPPGGCSDGPSIRLPSRRGSPYPRVVLLACGSLPASLSTTEVGDHDQNHGERFHFTSPPFVRFGLVELGSERVASELRGLTSRPCRRRSTRPPRESPRESPSFTSFVLGSLLRSHPRAVHARTLEQPPCHLHCGL